MQAEDVIVHEEHNFVVMVWLEDIRRVTGGVQIVLGVPKRRVGLDRSADAVLVSECRFEEWGIVGVAILDPFHALQKSLFDDGVEVDQIESLLIVMQQGQVPHLFLVVVAEVPVEGLSRVRARIEFLLHSEVPVEILLDLGPHHLEAYLICQPLGEAVVIVSDIVRC